MHVRQRRARGALLAGLAAFGLLNLALAWQMERPASRVTDPVGAWRLARLRSRARHAGPALLVAQVGSSRTLNGLRGDVGERELGERLGRPVLVSNQGNTGSGPLGNLLTTHRLLRQGLRP